MSKYINDEKTIWFKTNKNNGYQWLSNFWETEFTLNSQIYRSSEHYYQSQKYKHNKVAEKEIREVKSALEAKKSANKWKKISPSPFGIIESIESMYGAMYAKFEQNKKLKALLLGTGEKRLHEVRGRSACKWTLDERNGEYDDLCGWVLELVRESIRD